MFKNAEMKAKSQPSLTKACAIHWLLIFLLVSAVHGAEPSLVEQTLDDIRLRLQATLSEEELIALDERTLFAHLRDHERSILGSKFIQFEVDYPVVVYVLRSIHESGEIFWLADEGFEKTNLMATAGQRKHAIWRRDYDAGPVGLGINTFLRGQDPCFFIVGPRSKGRKLQLDLTTPGYLAIDRAEPGALAYVDDLMEIDSLPKELSGLTLLRPKRWVRDHARLINLFRRTKYSSTKKPDQIVMTWSEDPQTTQTIQWRTGPETDRGLVAFLKKSEHRRFLPGQPSSVDAETVELKTPEILNDPMNYRHTAVLRDLEPNTTYYYSIGDGSEDGWTELSEFTTAPGRVLPYSFVYMGDVQNGMDRWRTLMETALRSRPDAAFYIFAGDLVNRGIDRDDWDDFFYNGAQVFRQRQIVPVVGNHEGFGPDRHPTLYLDLFDLPDNNPQSEESERVYAFEYGNVLFLILDSMLPAESQSAWMDKILAESDAAWKIAVFHFPIYSAQPERDYKSIRRHWVPIFDRHHVDMVLQGHDHVYARSYAMRNNQPVSSAAEGTYYVIAYAGSKSYAAGEMPHAEIHFDGVSTYQVFNIQTGGDRLVYRSYDIDGIIRDELVIEK